VFLGSHALGRIARPTTPHLPPLASTGASTQGSTLKRCPHLERRWSMAHRDGCRSIARWVPIDWKGKTRAALAGPGTAPPSPVARAPSEISGEIRREIRCENRSRTAWSAQERPHGVDAGQQKNAEKDVSGASPRADGHRGPGVHRFGQWAWATSALRATTPSGAGPDPQTTPAKVRCASPARA